MIKNNFHEKISLFLCFLILNNYLLLSLSLSQVIIKLNFLLFLITILVFYFKNFLENPFLKIFFLLLIVISFGTPTFDWDPRSIWLFHAKRIFFDGSVFSVADNYASFSNNDYPSLAPAFASSFALLIGNWNEVFPKSSFTLMYLPPLILAYSFFKNTQYLIFLSIIFFIIGRYLFNGGADGLLALYFVLSVLLMYLLIIKESAFYKNKLFFYIISFCFFISLTLIKNEGIVLLLLLFLATFLIKLYNRELNKNISKFTILLFAFLPIILWKFFCYSKGIDNIYINTNIFFNLLSRYNELENYKLIFYFLFLNEKFLLALLLFSISFWINWNRDLFALILIITISYFFILFFIYLDTPFDFYFTLNSTAARIIKSLSLLLAFFGLYNLNYGKTKTL